MKHDTFVLLVATSSLLWNLVSSVYFPVPVADVILPDLETLPRPLPPLLRLHALQSDPDAEIIYHVKEDSEGGLFLVKNNEVYIREDRLAAEEAGRDRNRTFAVYAKSDVDRPGAAIVNVRFGDAKLSCDDWKMDMCFWTRGRYSLEEGQAPATIAYLSSEFLLRLCPNYSVSYRVLQGRNYVRTDRVRNTNADSWVLSLEKELPPGKFAGEISCSVSTDKGPSSVFRQSFEVTVAEREEDSVRTKSVVDLVDSEKPGVRLEYPASVEVSRYAAVASRVVAPVGESLRKVVEAGLRFRIDGNDVLGVTESGGIVYVNNQTQLRNSTSFSVRLTWTQPKGPEGKAAILVNVANASAGVCGKLIESKNRKSCSQRTSESECRRTCGTSSGLLNRTSEVATTMGCQWRHNEKPEALSVSYRTCSPDLVTCPDRFCDPLEKLYPNTCPQDCAVYVYGSANKEASPGISSAAGVCSCSAEDEMQSCTCDLLEAKRRQGKGRKLNKPDKSRISPLGRPSDVNVSVVQADNSEHCGVVCLSLVVIGSVVVVCGVVAFVMILYQRRLKKRYPNQNPLKEDMININYEEYIDRSAEALRVPPHNPILGDKPEYYDKKWEFPRYRLTVEQTIGEGEFGKVLKAKAEGIGGHDGTTTVAVKTLKENAKESELADLISEYQLLKEVDHPNIIHLLGACTTLDGPLYIIIEYAKHGSLRSYLRRNRHFGSELQLSEKESETSYMQSITPKDILTFAWQIAKGMAYLTEMKLVHRDLAARNVLVAEGLICKISDFGLTRDIYEDDTYLKRSKGRVPVKWMALESLSDHIYTTKSDVWSYGVVLWELVTTGASPYPGIAVQNLFHLLKSGYRMEKPVNCSPELYHILLSCWHENPAHRPAFKALVSKLEEMLGEGRDYLDLNPRIIENKTYFSEFPNCEEADLFLPVIDSADAILNWKFDCECPEGACTCRDKLRYENENAGVKGRYENEGVRDSSYVEPNGEPKPVNASPEKDANLYKLENEKKASEGKKI